MFQQLLESRVETPRRAGWTITSAGAHAALVAVATALTLREPSPRVERIPLEALVFTMPREVSTPRQPQQSVSSGGPSWRAPLEIPIVMPPVPDVSFPTDAPLRVGPEAIGPGVPTDLISSAATDRIYVEHSVERPVLPRRDNPKPEYPASLRSSHVEGTVLAQFVVDTAGRVESQSIVIVRATHPLFADAVRRWVARTRYSPARVAQRAVRQLVQQEIGFSLNP